MGLAAVSVDVLLVLFKDVLDIAVHHHVLHQMRVISLEETVVEGNRWLRKAVMGNPLESPERVRVGKKLFTESESSTFGRQPLLDVTPSAPEMLARRGLGVLTYHLVKVLTKVAKRLP
mgnify:CR=1 FL=1